MWIISFWHMSKFQIWSCNLPIQLNPTLNFSFNLDCVVQLLYTEQFLALLIDTWIEPYLHCIPFQHECFLIMIFKTSGIRFVTIQVLILHIYWAHTVSQFCCKCSSTEHFCTSVCSPLQVDLSVLGFKQCFKDETKYLKTPYQISWNEVFPHFKAYVWKMN